MILVIRKAMSDSGIHFMSTSISTELESSVNGKNNLNTTKINAKSVIIRMEGRMIPEHDGLVLLISPESKIIQNIPKMARQTSKGTVAGSRIPFGSKTSATRQIANF